MLKKIFYSIFGKIFPEIRILRKNINWKEYEDYIRDCNIAETATVFSPHKLLKVTIGDYSYINCNSSASNLKIGKFCSIGPNFLWMGYTSDKWNKYRTFILFCG